MRRWMWSKKLVSISLALTLVSVAACGSDSELAAAREEASAAQGVAVAAQEEAAAAREEASAAQGVAVAAQEEAVAAQEEAATATAAAAAAAAAATTTVAPATAQGPLLAVFPAVPTNIDPGVYQGRPTGEATQSVVSTLVRYAPLAADATALQGLGDITGELAESWELGDDGNYTFVLRDASSPTGHRVSSEDVRWSFERGIAVDFISAFLLAVGGIDPVAPIEIIDDRTFKLLAPGSNSLTIPVLTWYGMGIVDSVEAQEHATEDDPWAQGWMATNSATFGAYQVSSMVPGEEIRLTKNANYWGVENVAVDEVIMRAVPDGGSRMLLIGAKEVDFVGGLTYDLLKSVVQGTEDVVAIPALDVNLDKLSLNTRIPPFDDLRVRQAISLAIDRDALIEGAYAGFGTPGLYPISTKIPQPDPPGDAAATYDPDAARALLADAGLAEGFGFTLSINPSSGPGPNADEIAVILQSQLGEVGIDVSIDRVASPADFSAATKGKELEAWLFGTRPLVNDPAYFLLLAVGPMSTKLEGFGSEEVDALLAEIVEAPMGPSRDGLIGEMQQLLADSVPYVPLVETVLPWVHLGGYEGLNPNPTGAIYLQDVVPSG
jgi:peptide/nickel transport system substrate-binding protein